MKASGKSGDDFWLEYAKNNNLEAQNQKLIEAGYKKVKTNIKVLEKCKGSFDEAFKAFKYREEKKLNKA